MIKNDKILCIYCVLICDYAPMCKKKTLAFIQMLNITDASKILSNFHAQKYAYRTVSSICGTIQYKNK